MLTLTGHYSTNGSPATLRRLRVLVVDEDRDFAMSLGMLIHQWGHEPRVAFQGKRAMQIAQEWLPDVAWLDLVTSAMDGFHLAATLRKTVGLEQLVLIAGTGLASEECEVRAYAEGFAHFFLKPARLVELRRVLDEIANVRRGW